MTAVVHKNLEVNDHANPSLYIRPDRRITIFYSRHHGDQLYYRISDQPEDITSWGPVQTIDTNTQGPHGYTYSNPMRLEDEHRTYLFWRGGDWNPTFSTQDDGDDQWSVAKSLIRVQGDRPYVKYESNKRDTIYFAFTNAHPAEDLNVNIYYAYYKNGRIYRADGTDIGQLGEPISPSQADTVYDGPDQAWIHDVAVDEQGRPVIVFAVIHSPSDHDYYYARWTGNSWAVNRMTSAGGSIEENGTQPQYSAGITLDHEDPSVVYLSRPVGGQYEIEMWTTSDGGTSWSNQPVTTGSSEKNIRPFSPKGLVPLGSDMGVIWLRGSYPSYMSYRTSLRTLLLNQGNYPPIADAEWTDIRGSAPLTVNFDGSLSHDEDPGDSITSWQWEFGDGQQATDEKVTHIYTQPGHYFPKLTVTDQSGVRDTFIAEVTVK